MRARFSLCPWVILLVIGSASFAAADDSVPVERRPYEVRIALSFARDPTFSAAYRARVRHDLEETCQRRFGAVWRTTVQRTAARDVVSDLAQLGPNAFTADASKADKTFAVRVVMRGSVLHVSAREFCSASETLSPVVRRETSRRNGLADACFAAVHAAYRPLVRIEETDDDQARLRIRGAELGLLDPDVKRPRPGTVLVPVYRYFDREKHLRKVQPLPWTYLLVDEVRAADARATVASGLRGALAGSRRRVQALGLQVEPDLQETTLEIHTAGETVRPVVGTSVDVYAKRLPSDEPEGERERLLTDRRGRVSLKRDPAGRLSWCYVRSGDVLLARVPVFAGAEPRLALRVPDDGPRLEAEGRLELLQSDLVEVVARRALLMNRLKILSRAGRWKLVDEPLAELRSLPTIDRFERRVTNVRVPAVQAARRTGNRAAELRIDRMCEDALLLVRRYLDPAPVEALQEELRELRQLDEETAEAMGES